MYTHEPASAIKNRSEIVFVFVFFSYLYLSKNTCSIFEQNLDASHIVTVPTWHARVVSEMRLTQCCRLHFIPCVLHYILHITHFAHFTFSVVVYILSPVFLTKCYTQCYIQCYTHTQFLTHCCRLHFIPSILHITLGYTTFYTLRMLYILHYIMSHSVLSSTFYPRSF